MPKKILIATGIFPPDIGGPATYAETLLHELPKHGFDVRLVAYASFPCHSRESGNLGCSPNNAVYQISRNQNILLRYLKYFIQIWKLLSWADIIYLQDPISAGLPAAFACRLRGKKYLLKIVGDYAWEQGWQKYGVEDLLDKFQDKKYGWHVGLLRFIQFWTARNAEKIITPSNYLKNIILRWKIAPEKIHVIYNSVRKAEASKEKDILRAELGLNGDIIISSARLVPWKGFETLIDLMPELLNINPNFRLLINGEGPDREKLEKKTKELEMEKEIIMLGALPQKKLWEYMKASDIFVLNTGYEGLPHIIIEAFYLRLPVITTAVGGNLEVVRKGENGILVEYDNRKQIKNAILEVWKNIEVRDEMVKNARKDLEKFSVENMIAGLIKEL